MSLTSDQVQALLAGGLPPEHLPLVMRVLEQAASEKEAERKRKQRVRTQRHREKRAVTDVTQCNVTERDVTLPSLQGSNGFPHPSLTPKTHLPPSDIPPKGDISSSPTGGVHVSRKKFDAELWPAVPRKVGKDAAWRKYEQIIRTGRATHQQLLDGLERLKAHIALEKLEVQYIPHPATWLGRGGWEDDYGPPPKAREPTAEEEAAAMFARYQARQQASP